jgi:hypothetical protein
MIMLSLTMVDIFLVIGQAQRLKELTCQELTLKMLSLVGALSGTGMNKP